MRKVLIAVGIAVGIFLAVNGVVLAAAGIDGYQAFLDTQQAALKGLKAYFDFLLDLFKLAIS